MGKEWMVIKAKTKDDYIIIKAGRFTSKQREEMGFEVVRRYVTFKEAKTFCRDKKYTVEEVVRRYITSKAVEDKGLTKINNNTFVRKDVYRGKENHPQCCFFEEFPSSADPNENVWDVIYCHIMKDEDYACKCLGDYLKCPLKDIKLRIIERAEVKSLKKKLNAFKNRIRRLNSILNKLPETVDEAVNHILKNIGEANKDIIKNTDKKNLIKYHHGWGRQIRNDFGLWEDNKLLLKDTGKTNADDASMVIIESVWNKLQKVGVKNVLEIS